MRELIDHVDRVVRPVRASPARKSRMRQELLVHLTAVYDEERGRLGDDRLAAYQALRRFGDPAELTRELQAAIPRLERVLHSRVPWLGWLERHQAVVLGVPGESPVWHAVRLAVIGAAVVFSLLVLLPLMKVAGGTDWTSARLRWDVVAAMTAHAFGATLLVYGYCRSLAGRSGVGSLVRAAGFGAAMAAWGTAFVPVMASVKPDDPLWAGLLHPPGRFVSAAIGTWVFLIGVAVVGRFVDGRAGRAEAADG